MAKRDEVTSTERLLDLIRDDSKPDFTAASKGSDKSFGFRLKNIIKNPVSLGTTFSVGVDLVDVTEEPSLERAGLSYGGF